MSLLRYSFHLILLWNSTLIWCLIELGLDCHYLTGLTVRVEHWLSFTIFSITTLLRIHLSSINWWASGSTCWNLLVNRSRLVDCGWSNSGRSIHLSRHSSHCSLWNWVLLVWLIGRLPWLPHHNRLSLILGDSSWTHMWSHSRHSHLWSLWTSLWNHSRMLLIFLWNKLLWLYLGQARWSRSSWRRWCWSRWCNTRFELRSIYVKFER